MINYKADPKITTQSALFHFTSSKIYQPEASVNKQPGEYFEEIKVNVLHKRKVK
jgi:hypothetical protein